MKRERDECCGSSGSSDGRSRGNGNDQHASSWVPRTLFPCTLPCLLYVEDTENPGFIRFKEARAIKIPKKVALTLCTEDVSCLQRFSHDFSSRAHFSILLFVCSSSCKDGGEISPSFPMANSVLPRAIKMSAEFKLEEEINKGAVMRAWDIFLCSERLGSVCNENDVDSSFVCSMPALGWMGDRDVFFDRLHRLRADLCTTVCIPLNSAIDFYSALKPPPHSHTHRGTDNSSEDGTGKGERPCQDSWDVSMWGRMLHESSCTVYSGYEEVPMVMVASYVLKDDEENCDLPYYHALQSNHEDCYLQDGYDAHRRADLIMSTILDHPVRPAKEYTDALARVRYAQVNHYKDKSLILMRTLDERTFRFRHSEGAYAHNACDRNGDRRWDEHDGRATATATADLEPLVYDPVLREFM